MKSHDKLDFIEILKANDEKNNPFSVAKFSQNHSNSFYYKTFKQLPKNEMCCPICLHSIIHGVRPNTCFHAFCGYCLKKWAKTKKVCPYCRKSFNNVLKISLSKNRLNFQGGIF